MSVLTEIFPLLRGRTGLVSLSPKVPIVIRLYRGNTKLLTHRASVLSVVKKKNAKIGVKPVTIPYRNIGNGMTHITYTLDYPLLDNAELVDVECEQKGLGRMGTITLVPKDGCLFTMGVSNALDTH